MLGAPSGIVNNIFKPSIFKPSFECRCGIIRHYVKIKKSWLYWKIEDFSNGSKITVVEAADKETSVTGFFEKLAIHDEDKGDTGLTISCQFDVNRSIVEIDPRVGRGFVGL